MAKVLDSPFSFNTTPIFTGATTDLTMAQGRSAVNLKSNLHVSDTDIGQTETWRPSASPAHGTLTISANARANSGSANITPGGTIN